MGPHVWCSAYESYFLQAARVRRLVLDDFAAAFARHGAGVDVLLTPTAATTAPPLIDRHRVLERDIGADSNTTTATLLDEYANDVFTVPASLAGAPAIVHA